MFKERVWFYFRFEGRSCFNCISDIVSFETLDDITRQLRDFVDHRDKKVVEAYWTNNSQIRTYVRRDI